MQNRWTAGFSDKGIICVLIFGSSYFLFHRTQLNAYPPKPKANVDLFTSYVYGDEGVTVTLIIKTSEMARGEVVPILQVELFMAPPQHM